MQTAHNRRMLRSLHRSMLQFIWSSWRHFANDIFCIATMHYVVVCCGAWQVKGFFMSLFIASTGLVMSPRFLAAHLPVLAAGVFLVVLGKGILVRRCTPHPLPRCTAC